MSRIRLDHLVKRYGGVSAVSGLALNCNHGELVALVGPPGAGKTTTLKLISGIEQVSGGRIFLDDDDVTELPPERRDIAMAFESYALYPHLTVRGNLEFPLRAPGRNMAAPERSKRIQRVAELLEIGHLLDRRPGQLSGGQRQRVSLGRALVRRGKAALLDEPIAHLDARLRHDLRGELKRYLRENSITTVYATPDFAEAAAIADRIAVIIKGELRQYASPQEVFEAPADTEVALLAGDPKINLFEVNAGPNASGVEASDARHIQIPTLPGQVSRVGVRPSQIKLLSHPEPGALPGSIYVTEPIGYDQVVRVDTGSQIVSLVLPAEGQECKIGQQMWMLPDWNRSLWFDGAGKRIDR